MLVIGMRRMNLPPNAYTVATLGMSINRCLPGIVLPGTECVGLHHYQYSRTRDECQATPGPRQQDLPCQIPRPNATEARAFPSCRGGLDPQRLRITDSAPGTEALLAKHEGQFEPQAGLDCHSQVGNRPRSGEDWGGDSQLDLRDCGKLIADAGASEMNYRYIRDLHTGQPAALARLIVQLPNLVRLYWRLMRDPRVSLVPKVVLVAGILYFLLPFDLLPDFPLIGLGWLDDLVIVALALSAFVRLCPARVVQEHVQLIDEGG